MRTCVYAILPLVFRLGFQTGPESRAATKAKNTWTQPLRLLTALVLAQTITSANKPVIPAATPTDAPKPRFTTGEPQDPKHAEYTGVTFQQRLNEQVDLTLQFRDEDYQTVTLADCAEGKPVILALVYYECPALCNLTLDGLRQALSEISPRIDEEFEVVTVSFDHTETHVLAAQKKASYLEDFPQPKAAEGWHFLTGDQSSIGQLADAVGFDFKYNKEADQFAHGAGIVFLTPGGRVSRYLPDFTYEKQDMEFALIDASQGKIGSLTQKLFATCYAWDPATGKYNALINKSLIAACLATLVIMAVGMVWLIRLDRQNNKKYSPEELEEMKAANRPVQTGQTA